LSVITDNVHELSPTKLGHWNLVCRNMMLLGKVKARTAFVT